MKWLQLEQSFDKLIQKKLEKLEEERKKAIQQLEAQVT
jgi:hypothetical protein